MNTARLTAHIQDLLARYREVGYFPSASVRVFNAHETLATACTGDAQEDSLFDVASLTKIATTTRVLLAVERGHLALDTAVADCFDEIRKDAWLARRFEGVTLRMLLTHTSTLTPWFPFYSRRDEDFWQVLRYALEHTEVVQGMEYSDLNFMLLGELLNRISRTTLNEGLQSELVELLGLGRMMYHPPLEAHIIPSCYDNTIEMQMCADRNITFDGFRPLDTEVRGTVNDGNAHYFFHDEAGHAGIFADTQAYAKLCQFYMNSPSSLLRAAQKEQPGAPTRGLGFQTGTAYPHGCGHTGFTGTSIYFSAEHDIGVVAFTNRLFFHQPSGQNTGEFRRALHESVLALAAK